MTPDGRRVTFGVRLSEDEAARADAARGELDRSAWLRSLVLAAIGDAPEPAVSHVTAAGMPVTIISDDRMPPGLAAVHSGGSVAFMDVAEEPAGEPVCKHPAEAVEAGECGICGADVW